METPCLWRFWSNQRKMQIVSSQEVPVHSVSARLLSTKPKVFLFRICCSVIQTPPKAVSQPSPIFGASMATHYSPLITISCLLAGIKIWPWCGANHVKTGGVFLGGRSSNFKALRQKQVGCLQERQNRPVYVGQESEGGSDGTWGRE